MQPNAIDITSTGLNSIAIQHNHDLQENSKKLEGRSVTQIGNVIGKKKVSQGCLVPVALSLYAPCM